MSQLVETCKEHFHGQPCIGCPLSEGELRLPGFVISQTPIPRKVALKCQKVLEPCENVKSCQQCLRLGNTSMIVRKTLVKAENPESGLGETSTTVSKQEPEQVKEEPSLIDEEKVSISDDGDEKISQSCEEEFACNTANCGYRTEC